MNFEFLNLFPELRDDVCSFRWKLMRTSFRAKDLVCVFLASNCKILHQGRSENWQGNALCSSRTSDHIPSHVSPVRLDTRGQMVTHVAGSSNGIISSLAGPVVIKPRCRPGLSNFCQPQHNFLLKQSCDCNGRSLKETLRETMEFLVIFDLVKVLPERLFLPGYCCSSNTNINEISIKQFT